MAVRKRRIDRSDVVRAACEVLDAHGADALSMARVAERLGVTPMALYRHVADRRDLDDAVVEHVLADLRLDPSSSAGWRHDLAAWMHQVREHWLRHPWLGQLLGDHAELTPSWLAILDQLAVTLAAAGLGPAAIARELVHISRTTAGIVLLEIAAPLPHAAIFATDARPGLDPAVVDRWNPVVEVLASYSNDAFFADVVAATVARVASSRP